MSKISYILKEMGHMIKKEKMYFIAPILILFAVIAFLAYHIGPAIIISFIYAGI